MAIPVGQMVREARQRHGLTQQRLARRCATSQRHIGRIERGEVSPSVETLERLLRAMGERLVVEVEPGPRGNQSTAELRAARATTTPGERIVETAALSEFLTGIHRRPGAR
ncbi:MAG: helix-turn-helix transcriptional regulator [Solirubrobacterales bacterium]|nr:helix-turn-helix transcriptional regulator [Solirubrobacterales bacterium]